ncbi:hypothetical protein JCM10213_004005 [Rhodosporidiobolus nylandii]
MATRRAKPFNPPPSRESFRDLLVFEERLKQNALRLQKQRRKYEAFLVTLIAVIAYLTYIVFVVPSIYSLVHYGNVAMLLVAGTTLVLFFATGMYSEKIAYAHKFVPQANRALRPFNIYLNTRHRSRFSLFNLFRSNPPSPAGTTLSRTPSGRSIASDLSSPPLSRRPSASSVHSISASSSSGASFRSGGAFRSPSPSPPASPPLSTGSLPSSPPLPTVDDGPVTRAPVPSPTSLSAPARGVPIPPIPPAQNPRGEIIFSSRVSPQFREGYERYRGEWEKRRAEARRLQRGREGGWRSWLTPWRWGVARTASPSPAPSLRQPGGPNEKQGEELEKTVQRSTRSRESSAAPSEAGSNGGYGIGSDAGSFPPSRSPSPAPDPSSRPAAPNSLRSWPSSRSNPYAHPPRRSSPSPSPVLSSTSTPTSSSPPSRSPSPSRSLSPPGARGSPARVRAESFSELLTMETEGEEERGEMQALKASPYNPPSTSLTRPALFAPSRTSTSRSTNEAVYRLSSRCWSWGRLHRPFCSSTKTGRPSPSPSPLLVTANFSGGMPPEPYRKVTVDFGYDLAVTVDFDMALASDKFFKPIPLPLPLAGQWELTRGKNTDGQPMLMIHHGELSKAGLGHKVAKSFFVSWIDGDKSIELGRGSWTTEPLPGTNAEGDMHTCLSIELHSAVAQTAAAHADYDPTASYRYRLTVHLTQPSPTIGAQTVQHAERLAGSENTAVPPRRARKSGAQPVDVPVQQKDFEDSDDETDAFLFSKKPPSLDDTAEASDLAFREISITQTAYSTYRAFLVYLQTGFVHFAPLRSAVKPSNPSVVETGDDFLGKMMAENECLPLPVSPKSMYRLADLHRLAERDDRLGEICLPAFSDSLTIHGAASELFSDTSVAYEPIRKAALAFVVERFEEVSASESWKEMMGRIERDEVPGTAPVPGAAPALLQLLKAREAASAKKG